MRPLFFILAFLWLITAAVSASGDVPEAGSGSPDQPLTASCAIPEVAGVNVPSVEEETVKNQALPETTPTMIVKTLYTR